MSLNRNSLLALAAVALSLTLSACGTAPTAYVHPMMAAGGLTAESVADDSGKAETKFGFVPGNAPPASQFQTIQATVSKLLPDTHNPNNGLDHQNFVVVTTDGVTMDVNNDITNGIGTKVANLTVGEKLTIRGIEYHDPGQDGIHWTHHNVAPNDAGFIQTPDGHVYQ